MSTKNDIIQTLVENLTSQRAELNSEIAILNTNDTGYMEKRSVLEMAITNIDMQIGNHITSCESNQK